MAEHNNSNKEQAHRHKDLAYEPQGMPSERVRRLQSEREVPKKTQVEIKRHTAPALTLSEQNNSPNNNIFKHSRRRMVQEQLIARGITNKHVLRAMENTPRHLFVSEALHATAYDDRP